jgi:hypothetical protein
LSSWIIETKPFVQIYKYRIDEIVLFPPLT